MSLFKNEVGRPSNETLRKRRIVYITILLVAVIGICLCVTYTVKYFKTTGTSKNISSGSIYSSISIKNKSGPIYVGTEKTKENDFKVVGSKSIEIGLNNSGKANIVLRTTYDSVKTYGEKVGKKKYYYQMQTTVYDKNNKVLSQSKKVEIKKTTIDQSFTIDKNAAYIGIQYYAATQKHAAIGSLVKVPIKSLKITNLSKAIPDSNFASCILNYYRAYHNVSLKDDLTDKELQKITGKSNINTKALDCSHKYIADVTGIEKMTSLVSINLGNNSIKSINVSKNTKLEELYLNNNSLTNIDLSKNIKLKALDLGNNQISTLNLKNLTSLKHLKVNSNNLKELNTKNNLNLETLNASSNHLKTVGISSNKNLYDLDLSRNKKISDLDLSYNEISSIDVTNNTNLKNLVLSHNSINKLELTKNTKLEKLNLENNSFKELDVSKNTKLKELRILTGNQIKDYQVNKGNNKKLKIS